MVNSESDFNENSFEKPHLNIERMGINISNKSSSNVLH